MKHKRLKLSLVLLLGLGLTNSHSQESLNTSGGNASGSGSVSYSVGQTMYQVYTGTSGSVTTGVQQNYKISVVTGGTETEGVNLSVLAYPNPVVDKLTLTIEDIENSSFSFQLFDAQGKVLDSQDITSNQTSIEMTNLAPATYFVKAFQNNQEIKTFKIIKN